MMQYDVLTCDESQAMGQSEVAMSTARRASCRITS